ncbi:hypothetical protein [uncultured Succinivibrio sp.]|uniref:hypothetical protein n=1 Tax=uncultured Succinivibrio sp. TaxID=540749 RepID=UPI0025EAEB87|nr:hypothetical protein [uncultured Succinivibrio sp.]
MILPKNTPYEEFIETNIKIYQREYGLDSTLAKECAQIEWDIREEVKHTRLKDIQKAFLNPTPGFGTRPIHITSLVEKAPVPTAEDHHRNAVKRAHEEIARRARLKKQEKTERERALAKAQSDAVRQQSEKIANVVHADNTGKSEHKKAASSGRIGTINRDLFEKYKTRRVLKVSEVNLMLGFNPDSRKPDDFPRAFKYAKELVYTTYKVYDWIRANKDRLYCMHRLNLN